MASIVGVGPGINLEHDLGKAGETKSRAGLRRIAVFSSTVFNLIKLYWPDQTMKVTQELLGK